MFYLFMKMINASLQDTIVTSMQRALTLVTEHLRAIVKLVTKGMVKVVLLVRSCFSQKINLCSHFKIEKKSQKKK